MDLYTMGFTQKSAEKFFGLIKQHHIQILADIRLNNKSQLAGFTKGDDLKYFLREICSCKYIHCLEYAPSKEILDGYKKEIITWREYERQYTALMTKKGAVKNFADRFSGYASVCLLCSEPTPEHCHRRLFAEMVNEYDGGIKIIHI